MKLKIISFFIFLCFSNYQSVAAQVTTAGLSGLVSDDTQSPLIGATIVATHLPSGTQYGTTTLANGRFQINNMRVGGPYLVEATYIGYEPQLFENIMLNLGQKQHLSIQITESAVELESVIVTAKENETINRHRTGASTNVTLNELNALPTIARSAADFTRLTPMASDGGSFAGRNDQFNNFSLDGTIFNNPFGLDAATPGGQTDAQPIPLDAIEQIQVAIAPYDVTQSGFTGASVNAVTRSGNNQFQGSVYSFFRNADLTGGKVDGVDIFKGDLEQLQIGFRLGGPIIKDKLFFFTSVELENRSDLGSYFLPNTGNSGANISRVLQSDLELVSSLLQERYGYDTGDFRDFIYNTDNIKGIFKLDFNISKNHTLTASYNFLDAFRDLPAHPSALGRRGPDFQTLQFENSGYRINNIIHSGIAELKSILGSQISNKFQIGFTAFRDTRDPFSEPFPMINIGKDGVRYIVAGHEPFSVNNRLYQDVFQARNDLTVFSGKHTWTFGTAFERFNFDNSFNLGVYGGLVFAPDMDITAFPDAVKSGFYDEAVATANNTFETNNTNNSWALAETNLGQWSIYAQDEIAVSDRLNVTVGLRVDWPLYFDTVDKINESIERNCCYEPSIVYFDETGDEITFDHTVLPKNNPLINPRFGFNYDIKGDGTSQLRGGTGLFSGRFPFVWIDNQVASPNFFYYNITEPDFKFPQVWRTNIGYDRTIGDGWIGTVDLLYTRDIVSHMVKNFGFRPPSGQLQGIDDRPIYTLEDRALAFGEPTNAYVFTNVNKGYSFNASFQLEKSWDNAFLKMGYNFLKAEDVASLEAEISSDAYDRNPANRTHTNDPELAPSLYGNRHRIFGALSKRFPWATGKNTTTISLFIEYLEGRRYSYTYSGDLNNDGSPLNDLLYIPTDAEIDQLNFTGDATAQRAALKDYIAQDDYLSSRRGEYAEKYGALEPWYSTADVRILQDIHLVGNHQLQISLDVLNIGNLLNSSWGVRQFATNTSLVQPISVTVTESVPTYTFDIAQTQTFFNDFGLNSRWQMQIGLRYSF